MTSPAGGKRRCKRKAFALFLVEAADFPTRRKRPEEAANTTVKRAGQSASGAQIPQNAR
jgi:hypothetical protein